MNDHDELLLRDLFRLKRTLRTGWLHVGVERPESVADHTFGTAILAWRIARDVSGVDAARVVLLCLLHDFHEARLGDIPSPAKPFFAAGALESAERRIIADQWSADVDSRALAEEFLAGDTEEARLARAIDHLEFVLQAREYRRAGHVLTDVMLERAKAGPAYAHPVTRVWIERSSGA
ncbi:MAG: HD family hydrolase [Gemmatimonadetes bacterium]|nr:HD family hydrolase [Gemmatimonadota bacterium]